MSSKYTVLTTSLIGSILPAIALAQTVPASTAASKPSGASDEIVHMEPFAVVPNEEGYIQSTSTVATRTNRQTIEIPQTISVFTDDFLKDIGAFDAETAITYVGNMYVRDDFGNPGATIIRGFERAGEVYVDGFRDAEYPREAAAYDRMRW
jgi:catecholate siderophore receptor